MQSTNFTTNWGIISEYTNYEVSDTGLVKNKSTGRVLKPRVKCGYDYVNLCKDGTGKMMRVHRLVANAFIPNPDDKTNVDHIDGDKRNNHVSNLRWATRSENGMNRPQPSNNTSGFKGVYWHKQKNKWRAQIGIDGNKHHLGYFDTPEAASVAYDLAAIKLHGDFAQLNQPIVKIPITMTLKLL